MKNGFSDPDGKVAAAHKEVALSRKSGGNPEAVPKGAAKRKADSESDDGSSESSD